MPQPIVLPANPAPVDSDEDAVIVSRRRRSTRSTTNSPSKKCHTKAEEHSDKPVKHVQVVESSEELENADESENVEDKAVLAPQSLSTRNARASRNIRNISGTLEVEVSQGNTPVRSKSSAEDAGKRTSLKGKSLSHGKPQAGVKRKASGNSGVEEDDEVVPGLPEDRLWLHSVQSTWSLFVILMPPVCSTLSFVNESFSAGPAAMWVPEHGRGQLTQCSAQVCRRR